MAVIITLKKIRTERQISQEKLAVQSGISVSYIQKIEQNAIKRVSLDVLDKLCNTLSCDISEILTHVKEENV
jgi:DNA-binding Xre family transcriptional regulator